MQKINDQKPSAGVVVEKTPDHGRYAADILRVYPEAYFIHIIRDPRAVTASVLASSKSWAAGWAPRHLKDACRYWEDRVTRGRAIATMTRRYREVFYERLHADSIESVAQLFRWMQEPATEQEVAAYVSACAFVKMRSAVAEEDVDKQFYRRGEVDSWRRELSGPDIAIIERLTRKQMAELGYEPVAGRRHQTIAVARLGAYVAANKLAKAMRAGADRIKP